MVPAPREGTITNCRYKCMPHPCSPPALEGGCRLGEVRTPGDGARSHRPRLGTGVEGPGLQGWGEGGARMG